MDRRTAIALAVAFACVYLYAFPYFGALKSANELPRVLMTQEIVERRTFAIDARLPEMGSVFDVATTPDGRHYPNKAPGLSVLAVPVYGAARAVAPSTAARLDVSTRLFRLAIVTLPAILFLKVFLVTARRFVPSGAEGPARAALCAYALGSMVFPYALLFLPHALAAVAVGAAFALAVHVVRDGTRRPNVAMAAVGALAGLAVLCDYEAALGASIVVLYALARFPRRRPSALALALGAAPFALLLLAIHYVCFGSPWTTGYSFSPHTAHREGWLGLVGPNGPALWVVLLAPDNGLFVFSPWVVLSIAGAVAIARDAEARSRIGVEAAVAAAIVLGYVLVVGSLVPSFARGGWSVGPRYVAVAIPFAAWLAAAGLASVDRSLVGRTLAHALVLVGVISHVLAASTYPHWPDMFVNPLHEISVRALREGLAPHSLGTMAGLSGLGSLLPLYAVVAGLCAALLDGARGRRWITLPVAAGLAVLVVFVAYVRFPASGPETEEVWGFVRRTWEPLP